MTRYFQVGLLLASLGAPSICIGAAYNVTEIKFLNITTFDGVTLRADVSLPARSSSGNKKFPVLIMANSWACPQIEYVVKAQQFASAGYIVVEYESRGWYGSGGQIDIAGPKDQRDVSEVISFVLNQTLWQPDPTKVALLGISYGAGLALLGAGRDARVKVVVAMSGWTTLERALFEFSTPNLVWGDLLVLSGHVVGKPLPELDVIYHQVMSGDEQAFRSNASLRSPDRFQDELEARGVPIFFSNNFEDRLFHPQDALDFFQRYKGPKRLLLNQGIHASAEIGGLVDLPHNHVWVQARLWLDRWLKHVSGPAPPLVDMQLRSDRRVHEEFESWPSARVGTVEYSFSPRGGRLFGKLVSRMSLGRSSPEFETISFSKKTGITAGMPLVGEALQVFLDMRIRSPLLLSSREHALWYYTNIVGVQRFCGTPYITLDVTPTHSRWQVVAYVFGVDRLTKIGTLVTHGAMTCWNCTAGKRQTVKFELRTFCEDLGHVGSAALGVALNLYSDLYQPANAAPDFGMSVHYSSNFSIVLPVTDDSKESFSSGFSNTEVLV